MKKGRSFGLLFMVVMLLWICPVTMVNAKNTGWTMIDGQKYYFDESTGEALTGVQKIGGHYYVFSGSGKMYTNRYYATDDGKKFYLGSNGRAIKGKKTYYNSSGKKRISYFNGDGTVATNQFKKSGGYTYYFKANGLVHVNGLRKVNGKYYYADKNGRIFNGGWKVVGKEKYYFNKSTGAALTGVQKIGGYYYVFGGSGKMYVDRYYSDEEGRKFYLGDNGRAVKGKKTYYNSSGQKRMCYFNGNGTIVTSSFVTSGNYTYYFRADGYAHTDGIRNVDGKYYYADKNGRIFKDGWKVVGEEKYYFNKKTGAAMTGVQKIGGYYYVFGGSGKMYKNRYFSADNGRRYYLGNDGRSLVGLYDANKENTYYFNGDGTYKQDEVFKVNGKIYYVAESGIVCKKGYRKVEGYYYYFDEKTGEAITGVRSYKNLDGVVRYYYFDPTTKTGYRTGKQVDKQGNYYFFSKETGMACSKFFCDEDTKKVYYIDPETFQIQMSGTVKCATLTFNVTADGSLDIASGIIISESDSKRTRLLKYGFSQLFKPYGGTGLPNSTPFESIKRYSCTEYVSKLYYEIGIDLGSSDIIGNCYDKGGKLYSDSVKKYKPGDIMFWNMDDCDKKKDEEGKYWIIDWNGDGICDRKHAKNEFGDGKTYHVHHVSIYLGNGQDLHASPGEGVRIHNYSNNAENTFYLVGVMDMLK